MPPVGSGSGGTPACAASEHLLCSASLTVIQPSAAIIFCHFERNAAPAFSKMQARTVDARYPSGYHSELEPGGLVQMTSGVWEIGTAGLPRPAVPAFIIWTGEGSSIPIRPREEEQMEPSTPSMPYCPLLPGQKLGMRYPSAWSSCSHTHRHTLLLALTPRYLLALP